MSAYRLRRQAALALAALLATFGAGQGWSSPAGDAAPGVAPATPTVAQVDTVSGLVAREQYAVLDSIVPGLAWSGTPEGRFRGHALRAGIALARGVDLADPASLRLFLAESDSAQGWLDRMGDHDSDALGAWLRGSLEGARAQYFNEVKGSPLKAVGLAGRSADWMRLALRLNDTLAGPRVSLALYDFWRSQVLRPLAWTPFVEDKREASLATLQEVVDGGGPQSVSAAIGLAWALIEMERPLDAGRLADSTLAALGEDIRGLLEPAGKAYFLAERWPDARDRYDRLVKSLRRAPYRNLVRETGALHRLAHIAAAQQDWAGVKQYADEALALPLDAAQLKRKQDDRNRLEKLRTQAEEHLAQR